MAISIDNVIETLGSIIEDSPIYEEKVILLSPILSVTVNNFVLLFGNAIDMTASSLLAIDNNEKGYKDYINSWKERGLIQ